MNDASDDGVIRGRHIESTDESGMVRMSLSLVNQQPRIDLFDRERNNSKALNDGPI